MIYFFQELPKNEFNRILIAKPDIKFVLTEDNFI